MVVHWTDRRPPTSVPGNGLEGAVEGEYSREHLSADIIANAPHDIKVLSVQPSTLANYMHALKMELSNTIDIYCLCSSQFFGSPWFKELMEKTD